MTRSNFAHLHFYTGAANDSGCNSICSQVIFIQISHLLSGRPSQVDYNSIPICSPVPPLFLNQSVFWITSRWRWWVNFTRCSFIQKLMDWFLLFNDGPLLLSVKGIIDLAQMPPTILLPHPGGTGTPTLERIAYLPGAQPPFPPRAFNPTSISPGEDPSLPHSYSCVPLIFPATTSVCDTPRSVAAHSPEVSKVSYARAVLVSGLPAVTLGGSFHCILLKSVHNIFHVWIAQYLYVLIFFFVLFRFIFSHLVYFLNDLCNVLITKKSSLLKKSELYNMILIV